MSNSILGLTGEALIHPTILVGTVDFLALPTCSRLPRTLSMELPSLAHQFTEPVPIPTTAGTLMKLVDITTVVPIILLNLATSSLLVLKRLNTTTKAIKVPVVPTNTPTPRLHPYFRSPTARPRHTRNHQFRNTEPPTITTAQAPTVAARATSPRPLALTPVPVLLREVPSPASITISRTLPPATSTILLSRRVARQPITRGGTGMNGWVNNSNPLRPRSLCPSLLFTLLRQWDSRIKDTGDTRGDGAS